MKFPRTNKITQEVSEEFGNNAEILAETLSKVKWNVLGKYYAVGFAVLLVSIFLLIVTVRLAFSIF